MKRFKDCYLKCKQGQNSLQLLSEVEDVCTALQFKTNRTSVIKSRPCVIVELELNKLPSSRVVVSVFDDRECVGIVNIVPLKSSGLSSLDYDTYNSILDAFKAAVFEEIQKSKSNIIEETTAEYTIEELIPRSCGYLNVWLNNYPLSWHPSDERRWFDFLIALVMNNETLGVEDLSKYIKEKYNWDESDLLDVELKYEGQMRLLRYYVGNYQE